MPFFRPLVTGLLLAAPAVLVAEDAPPLHQQIDTLIETKLPDFSKHAAPVCSDAEFLRRVTLDLAATIPSLRQTQEFLSNKAASKNKRRDLVTGLLESPRHAFRMQYLLDWILMENREGETVPSAEWQAYLRNSVAANKPWDALAQEILVADGAKKQERAPARFYLDRNFDMTVVTRDVGRVFLGVDLECAQCHNHPAVEAYKQQHYHGLNAFLQRSYLFTDPKSKAKSLGEKAEGDVTFTSVFDDSKGKTAPRILDLPEKTDPKDTLKQYITKPTKTARGVPKYSRRKQLGVAMIAPENIDFRLNIANRLWAAVMGRGLVEPLDLRHSANPASHPELLTVLGNALHEHKYDMRWFLGELVLTQTYQRSLPAKDDPELARQYFAAGLLKPLSPEQYAWATMQATGRLDIVRKEVVARLTMPEKVKAKDAPKKEQPKADKAKGSGESKPPTEKQIQEAIRKAVDSDVKTFVKAFATQGGQTTRFSATAPQALFLANGSLLQNWLKPAANNLLARVTGLKTGPEVAEELYMSILNRPPLEMEQMEVVDYLKNTKSRDSALRELAQALLLSAEFRFNH